ncbi:MAG: hypothetical protein IJR69_04855 [Bacteroidaceae bacterium]|nr:hypothetical protein [Bacteroidaceae bacterium]
MCCKKENDGTIKDREEKEMINLNDKKERQEFIWRYLNAETTLEEERLLADFLSDTDIALSAEEEDVLLMLQTSNLIGRSEISKEKADEFDCLMQRGNKKSKIVALRWIFSAVAAIICVVFFLPIHHRDNTEEHSEITTSELLETITILSDVGGDDMTITASSCNDGFIIKTSSPNEPPSSYMLKRCSDGTSIELKSQLINL